MDRRDVHSHHGKRVRSGPDPGPSGRSPPRGVVASISLKAHCSGGHPRSGHRGGNRSTHLAHAIQDGTSEGDLLFLSRHVFRPEPATQGRFVTEEPVLCVALAVIPGFASPLGSPDLLDPEDMTDIEKATPKGMALIGWCVTDVPNSAASASFVATVDCTISENHDKESIALAHE